MEYKRLTTTQIVNGRNIKTVTSKGKVTLQDLIDRLAEIEDKIEAGTLVTVPYAIGQEFYLVTKGMSWVYKAKVSLITIRHDGSVDIRINHYYKDGGYCGCSKYDPKYYELFNTEAEAEKRFEELRNEK